MPPLRKPAEKRQNHKTQDLTLRPVTTPIVPPYPKGLLKGTKSRWDLFWRSDVSSLVTDADMPALWRLFELIDERERCMTSARKGRLVKGSTGQPVLNPLYKHVQSLESQINTLEERFGLTPMSRLKLGVKFGEAQRTLADLNADAEAIDDDPRTSLA